MKDLKRAALYARVSSTEQSHNTSLGGQLDATRKYALKLGFQVVAEATDDVSGTLYERPGMDRLRDMAAHGLIDAVVLYKVDRLSRDKFVSAAFGMFFEEHRVKVIFVDRDASTPEGELALEMEEMLARHERRAIIQRTADGRKNKIALEGKVLGGGYVGYGYRWVCAQRIGRRKVAEGYLEINEVEAIWVRRLFSWFVQEGCTLQQVARRLQTGGAPTRRGGPWNISTVHSILKNAIVTGLWVWNKNKKVAPKKKDSMAAQVVGSRKKTAKQARPADDWLMLELPHLAIVDQAIFQAAQLHLASNKANARRNARTDYLLRGLVVCGKCGYRYHGNTTYMKVTYKCGRRTGRSYMPAEHRCTNDNIKAEPLENAVWAAIVAYIIQPDRLQVGQSADEVGRQRERDDAELAELVAQERKLDVEADRLLNLSTDPDMLEVAQAIGPTKLREKAETIRKGREHLTARRAEIEQRRADSLIADLSRRQLRRAVRQLRPMVLRGFTHEQKRQWLERLNVRVTIYPETVTLQGCMTNEVLNLGYMRGAGRVATHYVERVPYGRLYGVALPSQSRPRIRLVDGPASPANDVHCLRRGT